MAPPDRFKVLVVDDNPIVRAALQDYLPYKGSYEVHAVANPAAAMGVARTMELQFAVLDLKLDAADYAGIELAIQLVRLQPWIKLVFLSAWNEGDVRQAFADEGLQPHGYVWKGAETNHIDAVADQLKRLASVRPRQQCFVIMPFSATASCSAADWDHIFDKVIKPSVESAGNQYECRRADIKIGNIIEHVLDSLNKADIVIADLTDQNPNVFYELGVRHALRDATILIAQDRSFIPFDLLPYANIQYGWHRDDQRDAFRTAIAEVLAAIAQGPRNHALSPVRKYLKSPI